MPQARANGLTIEYESVGEGPPLLLIMGIGVQLVHWPDGFVNGLAQRGFRVIRFDNRDVGLSTKLKGLRGPPMREAILRRVLGRPIRAPYTLRDMADDTAGLMDALEIDRAHIVGISMGGMIAQVLASTHPERVRTLTSMMSTTGARRYVSRLAALRVLLGPAPRGRDEAIERAVEFYRVVHGRRFTLDEADIRERAGLAYDRSFYPAGFARHFLAILAAGNRTRELAAVKAPTLVLHGSDDPLIPVGAGKATARAIRGAKLKIVDGLGHSLPHDAWPILIDAIAAHAASA